jgi:acetylornithine deacetylase
VRPPTDTELLLRQLVEIDSVNPDLARRGAGEAAVGRFVATWAAEHGLEVSVEPVRDDRANVIAVARGSGGGRSLMLNAHLDTVGVEGYSDPFRCDVQADRLTGRGVLDTKAGLAAALITARDARRAGLRGDVVVAAVIDEEWASLGTEALVASERFRTDAAVVLEPTELAMVTDHRGFVWGIVTVHGVAAHGSRPDLGVDAIAHAGPILAGVLALQDRLAAGGGHPLTGPGGVHASLIAGGTELSTFPDTCRIDLERRTAPGETPATFERELEELVALASPAVTTTIEIGAWRDPLGTDHDHEFVGAVVAAGAAAGLELRPSAAPFWTDAALLAESGVPSVVFGPGGGGIHSLSEWVDRRSLRTCGEVLAHLAAGWCGYR